MTYLELFAGCGGMSLGLHAAGMKPVALVEWDKAAAGVLAHHWPHVPLFCDVQKFTGAEVSGKVDLLAFGSPCQDLSIAGKRAGLTDGERSSFFFDAIRIAKHLSIHNGLRYLLWENVVGALSSNQGADFAAVLGEMADLGARDIAWRVLDSQFFGVPQRRRRVFVVADLGGERAAEILSLAQGLRGDNPPSREEGQGVAGTLEARPGAGGGLGTDFEGDGGLTVPTITSKWAKGTGGPAGDECQNLVAHTLLAKANCSHALDLETYVTHTLRGEGFDASEDGTGRGTPLVAFAQNQAGEVRTSDVMGTLGTNANASGRATPMVQCSGVRRLTPRECERLQGWPDDHTLYSQPLILEGNRWIRADKPAKAQTDGPRYKQCGNGVTASVAQWISGGMKP